MPGTGDFAGAAKISVLCRLNQAGDALSKVWSNQGGFTFRDTTKNGDGAGHTNGRRYHISGVVLW